MLLVRILDILHLAFVNKGLYGLFRYFIVNKLTIVQYFIKVSVIKQILPIRFLGMFVVLLVPFGICQRRFLGKPMF